MLDSRGLFYGPWFVWYTMDVSGLPVRVPFEGPMVWTVGRYEPGFWRVV